MQCITLQPTTVLRIQAQTVFTALRALDNLFLLALLLGFGRFRLCGHWWPHGCQTLRLASQALLQPRPSH